MELCRFEANSGDHLASFHLKDKAVAQGLVQLGFDNLLGNLFQCLITLVVESFFLLCDKNF